MGKVTTKKSTNTPAVKRAAKDLRKGSGDAGLAMEEKKRIKALEKQVDQLTRKVSKLEKGKR